MPAYGRVGSVLAAGGSVLAAVGVVVVAVRDSWRPGGFAARGRLAARTREAVVGDVGVVGPAVPTVRSTRGGLSLAVVGRGVVAARVGSRSSRGGLLVMNA